MAKTCFVVYWTYIVKKKKNSMRIFCRGHPGFFDFASGLFPSFFNRPEQN